MPEPEYEYHGLMAQTWDLFRGDTSTWEDRVFYLDLIHASGQPVLDVGCGTGRLLLDYLSQGIDIDGVDISPEMLEQCQRKAELLGLTPTLYESGMENLNLPRPYMTILVPSSSFQLVVDGSMAKIVMERFFTHLLPGGILAMPFMQEWKKGTPLSSGWKITGEKVRPEDGAFIRCWTHTRFDPKTQLQHMKSRYEIIKDGKTIAIENHVRSPSFRQYTQEQAKILYVGAGFTDVIIVRGFTHQPASDEDDIFTIIGKRPIQF